MQATNIFATNKKSATSTAKFATSNLPVHEQSSILSLNFQDLQVLMKKKQKQYQDGLMIEDAKRVHNFLAQVEQQQKSKMKQQVVKNKSRLQKMTEKYNRHTLDYFQKEWKSIINNTLEGLEQVGKIVDEEHQNELIKAQQKINDAKNGRDFDKIKFSKTVLELEDQLQKLVKLQRYDEASVVQKKLQAKKNEQLKMFLKLSVEKEKKSLQILKKKQSKQKQIFSQKLNSIYERQQTRQANSIDKLVKNIRTYQIDPSKVTFKVSRILKNNQSQFNEESLNNKDEILKTDYAQLKKVV